MRTQPEVGSVAPRQGLSDPFSEVNEANPMVFVAYYRKNVMQSRNVNNVVGTLKVRTSVEVPASRVCPDADETTDGKPRCDWKGWDSEDSLEALPPKKCPGTRWDGRPCGKQLRLRNGPKRVLHARKYQFAASSPQEARFLASKFPRDTEPADEYVEVDGQRGRTHPGRGRTWRRLLDDHIIPEAERWNKSVLEGGKTGMTEEGTRYPARV